MKKISYFTLISAIISSIYLTNIIVNMSIYQSKKRAIESSEEYKEIKSIDKIINNSMHRLTFHGNEYYDHEDETNLSLLREKDSLI